MRCTLHVVYTKCRRHFCCVRVKVVGWQGHGVTNLQSSLGELSENEEEDEISHLLFVMCTKCLLGEGEKHRNQILLTLAPVNIIPMKI